MNSRRLEIVANSATILVSILLSVVLVKEFLLPQRTPHSPAAATQVLVGKTLKGSVEGVDWAKNGRTLVLALSTQCHFCTESAPFFRTLTGGRGNGFKVVALFPQPVPEARQYLSAQGVRVDEVKQVALSSMGVAGTPTLLLVDGAGVVTNIWVGRLQPDQEGQVLNAVHRNPGG